LSEPQRYRFFVHREQSPYQLVLRDGTPFPASTDESQRRLTRIRDGADVNADVGDEIAARGSRGYCLFAIGLTLDAIKRAPSEQGTPLADTTVHANKRPKSPRLPALAAPAKRLYTFARRKGPARSDPLYMQGI
jgi:hypothetical protein